MFRKRPKPLTAEQRRYALAGKLDRLGIVLVNFEDPVDGEKIAGLDWQQVEQLVAHYEKEIARGEVK